MITHIATLVLNLLFTKIVFFRIIIIQENKNKQDTVSTLL